MARRKRSTRFAGSPQDHAIDARKDYSRATRHYNDAREAAQAGSCESAFLSLRMGDKSIGSAHSNIKNAHPRASAESKSLNAAGNEATAAASSAGSAVRACFRK